MIFRSIPLFIVFFASVLTVSSQELHRQIAIKGRFMTVDELGNVYVVRNDNTLMRYNENGDSTGFYRSVMNGEIGFVDATNPLRVVVYYPEYFKVVLLDRMLSQKNDLDLRKLHIANASVIASSADGNIWVYDRFNARLKKIDEQLNEVNQSNDLRQELQTVPTPYFMTERDWRVYLCDTTKGIFVFDRYGSYVNQYPITGVKYLQVQGSKFIYRKEDSLYSWDVDKVKNVTLPLPTEEKIINAAIVRDKLYLLYKDKLTITKIASD